jgi:hypothetical protein
LCVPERAKSNGAKCRKKTDQGVVSFSLVKSASEMIIRKKRCKVLYKIGAKAAVVAVSKIAL